MNVPEPYWTARPYVASQTRLKRIWLRLIALTGGIDWTCGKLDVLVHDNGILVLWAAKLRDKGRPREVLNWRITP